MTGTLIKAGKLDEGRRMLADPRVDSDTAVKMLAERGKIEQALALMALDPAVLRDWNEMLLAVGVAYALRGDPKMATRFYDKAQYVMGRQTPFQGYAVMKLRFDQMILRALRGDTDGVKAALKELPAMSDKPSAPVEISRFEGYQELIEFLLRVDNPVVALDIAKSTPEPYHRAINLLIVAHSDAEHRRLDEARAILLPLADKVDPEIRGGVLRWLAIATAKSGDVTSAVALASQASEPAWRRAILFEVAQTLRPR